VREPADERPAFGALRRERRAERRDGRGRLTERGRQVRIRAAKLRLPRRENRPRAARRPVVLIASPAGFGRLNAALEDDKPPAVRHRRVAVVDDRQIRVRTDLTRPTQQNGRVILAAAVGPHTRRARKRLEREPVLDGAEIAGEILRRRHRLRPFGTMFEIAAPDQYQ
jgi:hypothetical protein